MNKIITTTMFITMGFTGMVIGLLTQSPLDQPVDNGCIVFLWGTTLVLVGVANLLNGRD